MSRVTAVDDLDRIEGALAVARAALEPFTPGAIAAQMKSGDDPVTAADLAVDAALREVLPRDDEGWFSEETADDAARLERRRVWIVDPVDGTREFVMGIPEWCVSIGLVIDGVPVAGGVMSPTAGNTIVGTVDDGVHLNGMPVAVTPRTDLRGALVLASRSEVKRGEWEPFFATPISIRNMGSVAYKLGCVAAGLADATWTLVPKNEWDVAAGAALVRAAGGAVFGPDGEQITFNQADPLLPGFVAVGAGLEAEVRDFLKPFRV
jgi:myo-inositol-1(or 4)-monophosphatase